MEISLKRNEKGERFWVLVLNEDDVDLIGDKDFVCQKCSNIMDYPMYFCPDTKKLFCKECECLMGELQKGGTRVGSEDAINTCKSQGLKKEHSHFCIRQIKIKKTATVLRFFLGLFLPCVT